MPTKTNNTQKVALINRNNQKLY